MQLTTLCCFILLFCTKYIGATPISNEIDLFENIPEQNNVIYEKNRWNWKKNSGYLVVQENVQQQLSEIGDSFSIEFNLKSSKKKVVSIFRATDFNNGEQKTLIEIQLDPLTPSIGLLYVTENNEITTQVFNWNEKLLKKWVTFVISVENHKNNTASFSFWGDNNDLESLKVQHRVLLSFSSSTKYYIGGRENNRMHSFTGAIQHGLIYIPSISLAKDNTPSQKKRSAKRKPPSKSKRRTSLRHTSDSGTLSELAENLSICRQEISKTHSSLQKLQKSYDELEKRLTALERCDCNTQHCLDANTVYLHNQVWNSNECTTCTCDNTIITCTYTCQGPCSLSPCINGGTCTEIGDEFQCSCAVGYTGDSCETTDYCHSNPCSNGAQCVNEATRYRCDCTNGYMGRDCETLDWCSPDPCENYGLCSSEISGYRCRCRVGYRGNNCEYSDLCGPTSCNKRGACVRSDEDSTYKCMCISGYSGSECETTDYCSPGRCLNGGVCSSFDDSYKCECVDGFTGERCEKEDFCSTEPCMNGAVCTNTDTSFNCACIPLYHGRYCENYDVCHSSPCLNNGQCVRVSNNKFLCNCQPPFTGLRCENNDLCASRPCLNGGTCQTQGNTFVCSCSRMYYGTRCELLDYCRALPCKNSAICSNQPLNAQQPFTCECSAGYTGNLCETRDLCAQNPCYNSGICTMSAGSNYQCTCDEPYTGDRCEVFNHCASNPCLNDGFCYNRADGFYCRCKPSYSGDRCESQHPCRKHPCMNGGHCSSLHHGSYKCSCPPTHYGSNCEHFNFCFINPCENGGSCINQLSGYTCECLEGFVGQNCSSSPSCGGDSCQNGGECDENNGNSTCRCPDTHVGPQCQYKCNICTYLPDSGTRCNENRRPVQRWYFNKFTQTCQTFTFTGCGGNINRFKTRQECRRSCVSGSCCIIQGITSSNPTKLCRAKSVQQCRKISVQQSNIQVIGFIEGETCDNSNCHENNICRIGRLETEIGESVNVGCGQTCTCVDGGLIHCSCHTPTHRREIRRYTLAELETYQRAIMTMKTTELEGGGDIWNMLRDEYIRRSPVAQGHFLLWNRAFLKKMEVLLKQHDCSLSIPYYDFTMDAGRFEDSVIWQPNYFGGEGHCVTDHPFRMISNMVSTPWLPCLVRDFNRTVNIPNMVDVVMATKAETLEEISSKLYQIVSFVKMFIGGDIDTPGSPYDPLFYSLHAYIDMLFAEWQINHQSVQKPGVMDQIGLGWDSDYLWSGLCVAYSTTYQPCNITASRIFNSAGYDAQGFNREGFRRNGYDRYGYNIFGRDQRGNMDRSTRFDVSGYDIHGYNRSGYSKYGYNRFGFDTSGFGRDGYNVAGYDIEGLNRYGLDSMGYDQRGFNIYGVSRSGELETTQHFDTDSGLNDCCFTRDGFTISGFDRFGFDAEGFDSNHCNYFFNGPHALYYQEKLWKLLSSQPIQFLITLQRNCGPLLPTSRIGRTMWTASKSLLSTLPSTQTANPSLFAGRFCFDVEMLMTWCPCLEGDDFAICHVNPCEGATCLLHPEARCQVNMCQPSCTSEFYLEGRKVNCQDPCQSNPCQNGGTCVPFHFSSSSELFYCQCPDEFTGSLCEQQASNTCGLPKLSGRCQGSVSRWYFNLRSGVCESFVYSGCGGNLNNFPNKQACDLRCSIGACCYRSVHNTSMMIGYDKDGFDKYGFNNNGVNRKGQFHAAHNSMPTGNMILGLKGYGHDGFDIYGYDELGFDRQGYDKHGFHRETGFNRWGYNPSGEYDQLQGFGESGFDEDGFDRSGFSCNGLNRDGFNQLGLYQEFDYECRSMSLSECDSLQEGYEVVKFSPGERCENVKCSSSCGCNYNGNLYKFGERFFEACQECFCTLGGTVECTCQKLGQRKEIRDLSPSELEKYRSALEKVHSSGNWDYFVGAHSRHMPHANGGTLSLPWHRYFLKLVERELQKHSDCNVHIPYFDWTIDVGTLNESIVWSNSFLGGNGEEDTNCVKHHPFGRTWHPCVRRNFNTSISLPDAVNFAILLHEPEYDAFRIQLEAMSALFNLWVGGHMASPFSPYDPLFLSHWAFMDFVFTQWQARNPHGMTRFPADKRYNQLQPFDVMPDDVLSTQKQSCVMYIIPTLGSPCNISHARPSLLVNEEGLDRHGFNQQGYNSEGFDADGRNRYGVKDSRTMYDSEGYSVKDGFHRSGFDTQGWDRFGYNSNDYNKDGIDIYGYDESGYDQYGFNRQGLTPFGMYKNGSFDRNVDAGRAASLFDQFGYNRYGFNQNGLDRNGYNAYGFNRRGYDRQNCNYHHNNGYYLRYFMVATLRLHTLPLLNLVQIKRVCPPISNIPAWISAGWLNNEDLVNFYHEKWLTTHKYDSTFIPQLTSVTSDLLWAPITPDEQFCFDLQWYSGCPLGTTLYDCQEDICSHAKCGSYPDALCRNKNCGGCYPEFYNGTTGHVYTCYGCIDSTGMAFSETSTWSENCRECSCHSGLISCTTNPCPGLSCTHPNKEEGDCCNSCRNCLYNDNTYLDGEHFEEKCKNCFCRAGNIICRAKELNCPLLSCRNIIMRPGDCCYSCPDDRICEGHLEGETWEMEGCQICKCMNQVVDCRTKECQPPQCSHPDQSEGKCCPECEACTYKGRQYSNRQSFMEDQCTRCSCTYGNMNCVQQRCPPLLCFDQITPDGACCPICQPGCEFEGRRYNDGDTFHPQQASCRTCTCSRNEVTCQEQGCAALTSCPRPVSSGDECCPTCSSCSYGEHTYRDGQVWTSGDSCERCICQEGNVECTKIVPCRKSCTHGVALRGKCCPECSRCLFNRKLYRNGEEFINSRDKCETCNCRDGSVTCNIIVCPSLQCTKTQQSRGDCCPQCKSCVTGSTTHQHGSSWRLEHDICMTCTCNEGTVSCGKEECPRVDCQYPVTLPDSCCQTCDNCFYQGKSFYDSQIIPSDNQCETCTCQAGNVVCNQVDCRSCTSDTSKICCDNCASCTYQQQIYHEAEVFISNRNPCLECTCQSGETECRRLDLDCPQVSCLHAGRTREQCCPSCEHCVYERRNYRNNTSFKPPGMSNCVTCDCLNGVVTCETTACPEINCPNPVTRSGECCPICQVCHMGGVTKMSGDTWSNDNCDTCTCSRGHIICEPESCPVSTCSHPAKRPGTCCSTCEMCSFDGRIISDGETFSHSSDKCQSCSCSDGNVRCQKVSCPVIRCSNPVTQPNSCCPTCSDDCIIEGYNLENGRSIRHPTEKCQVCTCTDGELDCTSECTRRPPCNHPAYGPCCKNVCDGCYYGGKNYTNNKAFQHNRDPCRQCTCTNGNVRCVKMRCPVPDCDNPQKVRGSCCRTCPQASSGCYYDGHSMANNEQFHHGCEMCRCIDGEVECTRKVCPPARCTHPKVEDCCRRCDSCTVGPNDYQDAENVPGNECQTCTCMSGNLVCSNKVCPQVTCTNPSTSKTCCPSCSGCLLNNREYSEGEIIEDHQDKCQQCRCVDGNVACTRKPCTESCTHPIISSTECCPMCGSNCFYNDKVQQDGSTFNHANDQCKTCTCIKGSVTCRVNSCLSASCRSPSLDHCGCSSCTGCMYNEVEYSNHDTFNNPADQRCSQCRCQNGNVHCERKQCQQSLCTHPMLDMCDCPQCSHCLYFEKVYNNGDTFVDVSDTCNECTCEDGNVECTSKKCPTSACSDPTWDRCGCPLCNNCNYLGVIYQHNERFLDSMNKCNQCTCKMGTVQCNILPCPVASCSNPHTPIGQCCPICMKTCAVDGKIYQNGQQFRSISDSCSMCTCSSGSVRCLKKSCGQSCTHPVSSFCCPDCSACLHNGNRYDDGERFHPDSDVCQQCQCTDGNIICKLQRCPTLTCENPRSTPGKCCSDCPQSYSSGCSLDGRLYERGEHWLHRSGDYCAECLCNADGTQTCIKQFCSERCSHPVPVLGRCCSNCNQCFFNNQTYSNGRFTPNDCQECMCNRGNVHCVTKACKPLNCPLHQQTHAENQCCPQCVSCKIGDTTYAEGQKWSLSDDICTNCQCNNGIVTCRKTTCNKACRFPTKIPGKCCSVCQGCQHQSQDFIIGEMFYPNLMDPCDECTCIAGSAGAAKYCHRVRCPSLADCPRRCVRQPEPGTCCPICDSDCSYGNCNATLAGHKIAPEDDKCFLCECNAQNTWVCMKRICPQLHCRESDQYTPKASCCPVCDTCHLTVENRDVPNGHSWVVSECQSCQCNRGTIECQEEECDNAECQAGMIKHRSEAGCCEVCVDPNQECVYEGLRVAPRQRWLADKCTACQCFAGKVECITKRCRMLMCPSDQVAFVTPGECCPECTPSPGSCVAFGDPHYRTFDGRMIHFQGACRYLMTSDCMRGEFRVEVQNSNFGGGYGPVTWTENIFMYFSGHEIMLDSNYGVWMNGSIVDRLPFLVHSSLFIIKSGNHILINTDIGVQVSWNALQRYLEVSVPRKYKQKTCGLCGNFNNHPQDDLRLRNSRITMNDAVFGNDWKINRGDNCPDADSYHPCDAVHYITRKQANNACKVIKSSLFSKCHSVVNPDMYFAACVYDVCACGENAEFCMCDAIEAYASQCRRANVVVKWRSLDLCAIGCAFERGFVFDECGSPCQRTCANHNLPPDVIDAQCYMPCVSGCQCPAGKVVYEGRCIDPLDCPDGISTVRNL